MCACSDGSVHVVNASLNADKGKAFVGMWITHMCARACYFQVHLGKYGLVHGTEQ